jgi:hypothetical protein
MANPNSVKVPRLLPLDDLVVVVDDWPVIPGTRAAWACGDVWGKKLRAELRGSKRVWNRDQNPTGLKIRVEELEYERRGVQCSSAPPCQELPFSPERIMSLLLALMFLFFLPFLHTPPSLGKIFLPGHSFHHVVFRVVTTVVPA